MIKIFGKGDSFENPVIFAPWSIIHFAIGMAAYSVLELIDIDMNRFVLWAVLHGIYELKDISLSYFTESCKWFSACDKSFLNSVGDETSALLGYLLARHMGIKSLWTSLAIVVGSFLLLGSPIFGEYDKFMVKLKNKY